MMWLRQWQWCRRVIRSVFSVVLLAGMAMAGQDLPPGGEPTVEASTLAYRLRAGESLSDIAQLFHVSLEDLAQLNHITDPRRVQIGQPLQIPNIFARQVSQLQAERTQFLTERAQLQSAVSEQHQQATLLTQQLQTLTADNTTLVHQLAVARWWRRGAVPVVCLLLGLGGWCLLLQAAQRQRARQLRCLREENTALSRVRDTYRQSVGQLELRYHKLYSARAVLSPRSLEEGSAVLARTFAQGCAQLERQLALLQAEVAAAQPTPADLPSPRSAHLLQRLLTLPRRLRTALSSYPTMLSQHDQGKE
jgi:LysM repeat protein